MSINRVHFSEEARNGIAKGFSTLEKAVSVTAGPEGQPVLIEQQYGDPLLTKDGVTVAKSITLANNLEKIGAKLLQSVALKTNDDVGDGTTTATILGNAIVQEGRKAVTAGHSPMEIKKGIDEAIDEIVNQLRKLSKEIKDSAEIAQVATVSANNDATIGKLISDAMKKVGKDGVITVEESKTAETTIEVVEGMKFDRGYISPYFVANTGKRKIELENPYILIHDQKISNEQPMIALIEKLMRESRPLLIIAEDVDGRALSTLILNHLGGTVRGIVAVKSPGFGDRKEEMLEDIAILTGGVVVTEKLNRRLDTIVSQDLRNFCGQAKKIVIDKETTTIIDGNGKKEEINGRAHDIQVQISMHATSDYDKQRLQERRAKLIGGVGVFSVGGGSEVEIKEKKYRVEDALNATRAAVEEGIVIGGGIALLRAAEKTKEVLLKNADHLSESVKAGINVVIRACEMPLRRIVANAGDPYEGQVVIHKVLNASNPNIGYNVKKKIYEDFFAGGIVDPTKVVRLALVNSGSIAGAALTAGAAITEEKVEKEESKNMVGPGMGGYGDM